MRRVLVYLFGLVGLVALGGLVGCLKSGTVPCGDRVCPTDTFCESETLTCVTTAAKTVCGEQQIPDGDVCSGLNFVGICQRGLCLPGCGDDAIAQGVEECDDGNFRSHDGCSSTCLVEKASWKQMIDPWSGLMGHVLGFHADSSFAVLVTGQSQSALRTSQLLARYESTSWLDVPQANPTIPSPRVGAMIAYDSTRKKLVLFGGGTGTTYFGETWEWDYATGWVENKNLTTSPPARFYGGMVFDSNPAPGRIVLFGGSGAAGELDDTWEYDGSAWTKQVPSSKPSPRHGHAVAYDPNRDRTVVYAGDSSTLGYLRDVWEYNAGAWTLIGDAPPGKRFGAAMAYAPDRGTIVMFGGVFENIPAPGEIADRIPTNDTWSYNGSSWTQLQTMLAPPARSLASLTAVTPPSDSGTFEHQLILVGGAQGGGDPPLADEWHLGLNGWNEVTPHYLPPARFGAADVYDSDLEAVVSWGGRGASISDEAWSYDEVWHQLPELDVTELRYFHVAAYDPKRHRMVSFGGYDQPFTLRNETFENSFGYPGQISSEPWVKVLPTTSPTARYNGVLAYDGTELVLFGGVNADGAALDETWTYDGVTWTRELEATHPSASAKPSAAYDPVHARMVLVDSDGATWTHANKTWTQVPSTAGAPAPPARDAGAMTFDYQTGKVMLAGGQLDQHYYTDIWELDGDAWHEVEVIGIGPLPRSYFGFVSSRQARQTFVIGGAGAALVPHGDVWTLQYRAQFTPDEDCENFEKDAAGNDKVDANGNRIPIDDDGDLHANLRDPDCNSVDASGTGMP